MEGRPHPLVRRRSSMRPVVVVVLIQYWSLLLPVLLLGMTTTKSLFSTVYHVTHSFQWESHQQEHRGIVRTTSSTSSSPMSCRPQGRMPAYYRSNNNNDDDPHSPTTTTTTTTTTTSVSQRTPTFLRMHPNRGRGHHLSLYPPMDATVTNAQSTPTKTTTPPSRRIWRSPTKLRLSSEDSSSPIRSGTTGRNANELLSIRQGSTVALITPFHPDTGKIDFTSLQNLLQYHIDSGTDNLCLLGTTGEAGVLSMAERGQVLTTAANMVKGRIPVMVGCGTINPHHVQEMIQQATDCGGDAALVVTPYYVKPPQRSLIAHYTSLADTSPLPLIIYNVPGRTAVDMSDASIAMAAGHDNIMGVKDATGKLERLTSLQQHLMQQNVRKDDFLLFSGDDETSMEYVLNGGDGCISVTANIAAKSMHDIMMASLSNDPSTAKARNDPLVALHQKLFCEANPMPIKYAASKLNLIASPYCRPPLDVMDTALYGTVVDDALRQAGLLPL